MKSVFIFLVAAVVVVVSHQQQQLHRTSRPRGLVWLTPYSPSHKPVLANYQPIYDNAQEEINEIPSKLTPHFFRRKNRPSIPLAYLPLNEDLSFAEDNSSQNNIEDDDEDEYRDEYPDVQSRIKWFKGYGGFKGFTNKGFNKNNDGRFFYSSTINNPFYKTATFTITSTVTTLGSVVLCVPANNLVAVPSPTCAGRKKREIEDSEDNQFPIAPSETLQLIPTALPAAEAMDAIQQTRESRVMSANKKKQVPHKLISSKEEVIRAFDEIPSEAEDHQQSLREERLFGGGYAASTTITSYSFVGATVTSTVLLDPTAANLAACLPAGYVVC